MEMNKEQIYLELFKATLTGVCANIIEADEDIENTTVVIDKIVGVARNIALRAAKVYVEDCFKLNS